MHASVQYDVGGALVAFGLGLIVPTLIICVIEAVVMLLLKWDKFGRSLWGSVLMNVTSTIFGIGAVLVGSFVIFTDISIWLAVSVAFLLSVFIEVGVLILMKRNAARLNWLVSLVANTTSYILVILPLAWLINKQVMKPVIKTAQHSVHPTGGSLRVFRLFAWLEVGSGKVALSRPTHQRVTQAVGRCARKSY